MPRLAIPIVIVVLLIGALLFLSTRAREVPSFAVVPSEERPQLER